MRLNSNGRRLGAIRTTFGVVMACCFLLVAAFTSAAAEDATITIDNFAFSPAILTIKPRTKVVFVNHDDIPHSVVDDAGKFRSRPLDTDESFSITFDEIGEIVYFCGLHPHMKGKIVVSP